MKKLQSTVAFLLLVFFLFGCGRDKMDGYKLYENDDYGFSLYYPEDWTFREGLGRDNENITGSIVVFQSPSEGKMDFFRENVNIFIETLPDSVTDVDSYLRYSKSYLPTQLANMNITEEGKQVINGVDSRWIIFGYTSRMKDLASMGYIFYRDGMGFVINSTSLPEDFMKFRRTFEKISTSIQFN
ncbi:hypothetical protein ASZ90_005443 [hydrocarbon metagenome]|uniref:PsbP C-terminal domain-containing protein n=1 Tax=hydrocarbon metagenome TaxID=938273 RepID=A0A0W8FUZ5_9ZZZZ